MSETYFSHHVTGPFLHSLHCSCGTVTTQHQKEFLGVIACDGCFAVYKKGDRRDRPATRPAIDKAPEIK